MISYSPLNREFLHTHFTATIFCTFGPLCTSVLDNYSSCFHSEMVSICPRHFLVYMPICFLSISCCSSQNVLTKPLAFYVEFTTFRTNVSSHEMSFDCFYFHSFSKPPLWWIFIRICHFSLSKAGKYASYLFLFVALMENGDSNQTFSSLPYYYGSISLLFKGSDFHQDSETE